MKALICATLTLAFVFGLAHAADRSVADSLAMTGATLAAKGNTAAAKDMLYKALANDENCPEAIFELAKIFDKDGIPSAASDFYQRASLLMAQENKPETVAKRAEADKRVKALNPFAPRVGALFEDYASDLDKLVKKIPDTVTQEAALARVNDLKLVKILPPEKMPKFYAAAQAQKTAEAEAAKPVKRPGRSSFMDEPAAPVTRVAPDVERELKAAGWATITGTWTKKGPNLYEVTDGKLEAPKANGVVDVWILKATTGTVKVMVHNDTAESGSSGMVSSSSMFYDYTGYGAVVKNKECRLYGPAVYGGMFFGNGSQFESSSIRTENIPDANPKNRVTVSFSNFVLEVNLNEKQKVRYRNDKIPSTGSIVIEVKGNATLETPRCAGQ